MKKQLGAALAASMMWSAAAFGQPTVCGLDVNCSGEVDVVDVYAAIATLSQGQMAPQQLDVNCDGELNIVDVQLIIQGALGELDDQFADDDYVMPACQLPEIFFDESLSFNPNLVFDVAQSLGRTGAGGGSPPPAPVLCTGPSDWGVCNDSDGCTSDFCQGNQCVNFPALTDCCVDQSDCSAPCLVASWCMAMPDGHTLSTCQAIVMAGGPDPACCAANPGTQGCPP